MDFDYEKDTRQAYRDDGVARKYHDAFASGHGLSSLRFRAVANRERAVIARMLRKIPHDRVLDVPVGTGKLAGVFAALGPKLVACDISENMIAIARDVYARIGYRDIEFHVCDATRLSHVVDGHFDAVVCLRLLHRVPTPVKAAVLAELAKVADHAIVSFGIENRFQRLRRNLRGLVFGGSTDALGFESLGSVESEIRAKFDIMESRAVIPLLSQERIFLLRPR